MSAKMADINKDNVSKIVYTTSGTTSFPTAGVNFTVTTYSITQDGLYFITYAQVGPYNESVSAVLAVNGTAVNDRIMAVSIASKSGSPSAEATAIAKLSSGDILYFITGSNGSTGTNDRTYYITVAKLT